MKILKMNLGLFSLFAVFAVSIFLTSCEQENIDIQENLEVSMADSGEMTKFSLPAEMNDKSEDEIIEFIESLSKEKILELNENSLNKVESRCGSWSHYAWGCSIKYGVYVKIERKYCGPPGNGGYVYRGIYYWGYLC